MVFVIVEQFGIEVSRRSFWVRMQHIASRGLVRYIVAQSRWMLLGVCDKGDVRFIGAIFANENYWS
jgi:hypothetical protein